MSRTLTLLLVTIMILSSACSALDMMGSTQLATENQDTSTLQHSVPTSSPLPTMGVVTDGEMDDNGVISEEKVAESFVAPMEAEAPAAPAPVADMTMDRGGGEGSGVSTGAVSVTNADDNTGAPAQQDMPAATPEPPTDMFFDDYGVNPFLDTADDHLSTFAMDVDTASYTVARNYLLQNGYLPPADAIRPEEFINYFDVNYENPGGGDAFAIDLQAAPAPFGYDGHYLLRVGIQGKRIAPEDRDPALLIFVIDVSGSMDRGDRLELVKEALALLVDELREDDRVGIVVYTDNSRPVLDPTPASDKETIMRAINALRPEGSTNVIEGLQLGYAMAEEYMRDGDLTRVIVLSDGVANVGITEPGGMLETIQDSVDRGINLSTIGFGMGNYNDTLMEQLANDGNGNYFYVDNIREARRIFVNNLTGTLQVIAYDAKIQVDFNPDVTDRYRLIGYENRAIADQDFRNDTVDAGEIGAGHSITALYELALEEDADLSQPVATAYIRYQDADSGEVVEINRDIVGNDLLDDINEAPADFRLHAAVAELSELLRESYWSQEGNYVDLLTFAAPLADELADDAQVAEFVDMVRAAGRYVDTK